MILGFPLGYDTPVGEGGATLSGGQRQRVGLARAVFGNPFLVVLDEPNSNLDPVGEQSLNEAIQRMRQHGQIVVIVAHRPSAIFAANKILSLRNGRAEMFGPKQHVLAALFPRPGQPHKPAAAPVAHNEPQQKLEQPATQTPEPQKTLRSPESAQLPATANTDSARAHGDGRTGVTQIDLDRPRRAWR
jgi:ATP-binding cassette, subfamily C, bacterial PrsD